MRWLLGLLSVSPMGSIWFSDASARHDYHNNMYDFLAARPSGRLLSHHPATGETRVHLEGSFFANGVALGPDDEFVLVNETGAITSANECDGKLYLGSLTMPAVARYPLP